VPRKWEFGTEQGLTPRDEVTVEIRQTSRQADVTRNTCQKSSQTSKMSWLMRKRSQWFPVKRVMDQKTAMRGVEESRKQRAPGGVIQRAKSAWFPAERKAQYKQIGGLESKLSPGEVVQTRQGRNTTNSPPFSSLPLSPFSAAKHHTPEVFLLCQPFQLVQSGVWPVVARAGTALWRLTQNFFFQGPDS